MAAPPLFHPGRELPILWEGAHLVVIDKPAGLAVHPGPQRRDNVEDRLLPQKRGGPWLVHRLDADTAGCLLIARRKSALIAAQKAFAQNGVEKRYWALVHGQPEDRSGTLTTILRRVSTADEGWKMLSETPKHMPEENQAPAQPETTQPEQALHSPPHSIPKTAKTLGRKAKKNRDAQSWSKDRSKSQSKSSRQNRRPPSAETGKLAQTSWRLLASNGTTSLLELTLHTGRTHQARIHCAALGTPIIGDPIYGSDTPAPKEDGTIPKAGLYLLAQSLTITLDAGTLNTGKPNAGKSTPHAQPAPHRQAGPKAGQGNGAARQIRVTATHPVMARFLAEHPLTEHSTDT